MFCLLNEGKNFAEDIFQQMGRILLYLLKRQSYGSFCLFPRQEPTSEVLVKLEALPDKNQPTSEDNGESKFKTHLYLAPIFEVQTDDWECFCSVQWDPSHADCSVSQVITLLVTLLYQLANSKFQFFRILIASFQGTTTRAYTLYCL
ncbi:hypothetical protein REPUB_Repub06bG0025900 [Reevesia pubescens]